MKDDHIQGILFNSSPTIRFVEAPSITKKFMIRAKKVAKTRVTNPLATVIKQINKDTFEASEANDTAIGDFLEPPEAQELFNRLRRQ